MNISLIRRRGFTRVRASRFVRVLKTHDVSTQSWDPTSIGYETALDDSMPKPEAPPFGDAQVVFAKPGDLAVEMVEHGPFSKLVGYAYISGDAIQLHRYDSVPRPDWFEDARWRRISIPEPRDYPRPEAFLEAVRDTVIRAHWEDADGLRVAVFDIYTADHEVESATDYITELWRFAPVADPQPVSQVHLIGRVTAGSRKRPGRCITIHVQPKDEVQSHCAAPFTNSMICDLALRRDGGP